MDQPTIITKPASLSEQICSIKIGGELTIDAYLENTVRTLCSSKQKSRPKLPLNQYPARAFQVSKDGEAGTVTVKRIR